MKEFLEFVKNLILFLAILWALFFFVIGVKMVPTDDMSPRLSAGDIMVYYKIDKTPSLNETIVLEKNETDYVGRVIATCGDKVEITEDSVLMVNDNMVVESNIFYKTPPYEGFIDYPVTLGPDEYFVLCDKREGGEDSRYYGPVKRDEIRGVVIGLLRRTGI